MESSLHQTAFPGVQLALDTYLGEVIRRAEHTHRDPLEYAANFSKIVRAICSQQLRKPQIEVSQIGGHQTPTFGAEGKADVTPIPYIHGSLQQIQPN